MSLAIAIVASAAMLTATASLRAARSEYEKARVEFALEGAHVSAAIMLAAQPLTTHVWTVGSPTGTISMRAEPEDLKLRANDAGSSLPQKALEALAVTDSDGLRAHLANLRSAAPSAIHLEDLDASALWKACVRELVSPWGRGATLHYLPPAELAPEADNPRVGQTWRVRALLDGWLDERTVLLTGAPYPLLRARAFIRQPKGAPRCDERLSALADATPAIP